MRAVAGSVISSKPISLIKASAILSRFATVRNGACREVAAYLHRASTAFDEVVLFHREIRAACKLSEIEEPFAKGEELRRNEKSRKRSRDEPEVVDGTAPRAGVHGGGSEMGSDGERKTKRMKKAIGEERTNLVKMEDKILLSNSNLIAKGRHYGDVEDGRRRKKEKKADADERHHLVENKEKLKGDIKDKLHVAEDLGELKEQREKHKKRKKSRMEN